MVCSFGHGCCPMSAASPFATDAAPSDTTTGWMVRARHRPFRFLRGDASMLAFGQRQRWRRRRNLLQRRRIASDLDDRPDRLAVLAAMAVLDVGQLRMEERCCPGGHLMRDCAQLHYLCQGLS